MSSKIPRRRLHSFSLQKKKHYFASSSSTYSSISPGCTSSTLQIASSVVNLIALILEIGSTITYIDLIYGLLLRSGNDAAVLLAQEISGSVDEFVSLMNQKAQEIGMLNTTFNNPTGLDIYDEGNYSTPYDVALLMKYALSNEMFVQISSTKYYKTPVKGMWKNKNRLLFDYEYCISGKTGVAPHFLQDILWN